MPSAEIKPQDKRGDCASDGAPNGGLSLCRNIHHVPLSMKECTTFHTNHGPLSLNSCGKCLLAIVCDGPRRQAALGESPRVLLIPIMVGLPLYDRGVAPPNLVPGRRAAHYTRYSTGFRKGDASHGSPSQIHAAGLRTLIGRLQSSTLRRTDVCSDFLYASHAYAGRNLGKEGTCLRISSFRTQANCAGFEFRSFRRLG
jgi:hypothetical protein